MGQVMGQLARQTGGHGSIRHRLRHQGHKGRAGGGEGQEGIQLAFGQLMHLPHPGEELCHPLALLGGHRRGKGQAG